MNHLYTLILVFSFDTMPPAPMWFASAEDCRRAAPAILLHHELTGRPVAWSACQRVPRQSPAVQTGEITVR